jgi:hypothetical protein
VMAVFAAPFPHPAHPPRGVAGGLALPALQA